MNKYSIASLALTATLLMTNANASSLVYYFNDSDLSISIDGDTVAPWGEANDYLGDNGATIVADGKTISITDSHTPCLRDTPRFDMPYAWYMNVTVDGELVGQLCAQLELPFSLRAESLLILRNSTEGDGHYILSYNNSGLYSAYYPSLSGITNPPVVYSW